MRPHVLLADVPVVKPLWSSYTGLCPQEKRATLLQVLHVVRAPCIQGYLVHQNRLPVGPCSRTVPRVLWGVAFSYERGISVGWCTERRQDPARATSFPSSGRNYDKVTPVVLYGNVSSKKTRDAPSDPSCFESSLHTGVPRP